MSFLYQIQPAESPEVLVHTTREAWMMLQTFGESGQRAIDPEYRVAEIELKDNCPDFLTFDTIYTPVFYCSPYEAFYLDQFPAGQEDMRGKVGFVALHMENSDPSDLNDVLEYAQMVFRLETHKNGPAVFVGDDEILTEVIDDSHLTDIYFGLRSLTAIAWPQYAATHDASAKVYPRFNDNPDYDSFLIEENGNDE